MRREAVQFLELALQSDEFVRWVESGAAKDGPREHDYSAREFLRAALQIPTFCAWAENRQRD